MSKWVLFVIFVLCFASIAIAQEYTYQYRDREHSAGESAKYVGVIYLISWAVYPLTQPEVVHKHGSLDRYRDNFGKFVFDNDQPVWNWMIHPLSGSQMYLFYRANGYSRIHSMGLSFLSSALFELTVEIYTEPASIQDLYQTPIFGSLLGVGLEKLSLYLLNSKYTVNRAIGHLINPCSLFGFFEHKVRTVPVITKNTKGLMITYDF